MSDKPKDEPQADSVPTESSPSPTDVTPATELKTESEATTESLTNTESARRPVSWLGALGLIIALLAIAGTGALWKEQQAQQLLNDQFITTQRGLSTRSAELGRVTGDIENLFDANRKFDGNLNALTKRIERQLEELPARMTRIEGTLDKIPGVAEHARSAWLLAEAEYFLRIANAQLTLVGNVGVSLHALELADAKIKALGDPGLTRVRAKISDERTALKAVPRPDAEGIVLELGSLSKTLHTLPLARTSPEHFAAAQEGQVTETGWQRAWRVIIDALSSIISVRRSDEHITPLMSAAEESMLIRSLDVELQIARLAVIRNEGDLYRHSLQSVADRLTQYFDGNSQQVKAAQAIVSRLANADLPDELPDISGSLRLLLNLGDQAAAP